MGAQKPVVGADNPTSPPGSLSPVPDAAVDAGLDLSSRLDNMPIKSLLPPRAAAQLNPPCTVGTAAAGLVFPLIGEPSGASASRRDRKGRDADHYRAAV